MRLTVRLGDDAHFRTVREFLDSSGFTSEAASERMGLARLDDIGSYNLFDVERRERNLAIRDPLSALVRLFLIGLALDTADAGQFLPSGVLNAMEALGLLARAGERLVAPVMMYPVRGIYVLSDRFVNPDATPVEPFPDFVYLPLQRSSRDFLWFIPDSPCESFLDLGTGQGIAALLAARHYARHAWGVDITARSVHFCEFSRRLNGIANATFLQGDLYQPCEGRQFDRIVMHPPYALASTSVYIYAAGGDDGEELFKRSLAEAHRHLAPKGMFLCWTTALDLQGAPLEQRVRVMLGDGQADCDVAVLVDEPSDPEAFAVATTAVRGEKPPQLQQWRKRLAAMKIERFIYGGIKVERHLTSGQRAFTVRRTRSLGTSSRVMEWLFNWEAAAAQPTRSHLLMDAKPRATPAAELHVRHQFREGSLAPMEYVLRTAYPFDTALSCRAWMAFLFSRCDGTRNGAELFGETAPNLAGLKLPPGSEQEHFLDGLSALISGGFVEIEGFKLPAAE